MGEIDDDDSIVLIFFADAGGKKGHKRLNKYLFPAGITTCTPRLQHFSMCNACARHGRASVRTTGARLSRGSATRVLARSSYNQCIFSTSSTFIVRWDQGWDRIKHEQNRLFCVSARVRRRSPRRHVCKMLLRSFSSHQP